MATHSVGGSGSCGKGDGDTYVSVAKSPTYNDAKAGVAEFSLQCVHATRGRPGHSSGPCTQVPSTLYPMSRNSSEYIVPRILYQTKFRVYCTEDIVPDILYKVHYTSIYIIYSMAILRYNIQVPSILIAP